MTRYCDVLFTNHVSNKDTAAPIFKPKATTAPIGRLIFIYSENRSVQFLRKMKTSCNDSMPRKWEGSNQNKISKSRRTPKV